MRKVGFPQRFLYILSLVTLVAAVHRSKNQATALTIKKQIQSEGSEFSMSEHLIPSALAFFALSSALSYPDSVGCVIAFWSLG